MLIKHISIATVKAIPPHFGAGSESYYSHHKLKRCTVIFQDRLLWNLECPHLQADTLSNTI